MSQEGRLIRTVTTKECVWLKENLPEGHKVYRFFGYTYGCISQIGVAITLTDGDSRFMEIPSDAVEWND